MPLNKEERQLFESISHEKQSPIGVKYRAELEKIDYMNETNKHPYYLKTIKEYARETSDARVSAFIETFKHLGKYPDEEDLAAFGKELNGIVVGFKDIFARVYKRPLAPDVPQQWIDAVLNQLSNELGMIPGLYSLPPLHRFISEGRVLKNKLSTEQEKRRSVFLKRIVFAAILFFVGLGLLFSPLIRNWNWLQNHPNRLGLYGCAIVILLGLCWAVIDEKRRQASIWTVIIGGGLVILQIIGR